jgi:glycosyltransferase 2 family protein
VVIAVLLLAWLLSKVNIKDSLNQMKNANLLILLIAVVIFLFLILISVWRWKIILDARNIKFSFGYLVKIYFACWFFNNILPTSIGGDVIRVIYTIKDNNKTGAFSATFVDRMIGFVGLFVIALIASLLILLTRHQTRFLTFNILGLIILVAIILMLFSDRAHRFFSRIFRRIKIFRLGDIIDRAYGAVKTYREKKAALFASLLLSLLLQADLSLTWFFTGYAIGSRISATYYFLFIPIVGLLTMIPLTIGGLGIRENSFVAFFTAAGLLAKVQATSISLLYLVINFFFALIGGIMFLFLKRNAPEIKLSASSGSASGTTAPPSESVLHSEGLIRQADIQGG